MPKPSTIPGTPPMSGFGVPQRWQAASRGQKKEERTKTETENGPCTAVFRLNWRTGFLGQIAWQLSVAGAQFDLDTLSRQSLIGFLVPTGMLMASGGTLDLCLNNKLDTKEIASARCTTVNFVVTVLVVHDKHASTIRPRKKCGTNTTLSDNK